MRRKKLIIIGAFFACLLFAGGGMLVLWQRYPGKWFLMTERVRSWGRGFLSLEAVQATGEDWEYKTLQELTADERCTTVPAMMLINQEHKLPEDYVAEVAEYKTSDVYMSPCIMEGYAALANAVFEKFSMKLYVRSAYRTSQEQADAILNEPNTAAVPGASEHQAGLALDVYVPQFAGAGFVNCEAGRWVNRHCQDYGFIIRYPCYGKEKTKMDYEPWHIRYVGNPHATIISNAQVTLEEYMEYFQIGNYYRYDHTLLSRQEGERFVVPKDFLSAVISPDNQKGYFLTFYLP